MNLTGLSALAMYWGGAVRMPVIDRGDSVTR